MSKEKGCFRAVLRWTFRLGVALLVVVFLALAIVFRNGIYDRFYLFPKQAQAWKDLHAQWTEPALKDGWNQYRGVLHSHSLLSHDSAATQPEIIAALKKDKVDFICMTDHYVDGKADYSLGWNGVFDGILFIRGYELDHGLMPWGIPEGTVFNASDEPRELGRRIHDLGAVLFYSHTEKDRMWDLPELEGMEIYNIHTDFLDEKIAALAPEVIFCLLSYPEQTLRLIFDRPEGQLARWDELNKTRHITGIAANDAHQNVGIRAFYTDKDTLEIKGTGEKHESIKEIQLNALTRLALRMFCGPLEPGRQLFRVEVDPYEISCRFVNTFVLAKSCTEKDILDSLRAGRAFVAFSMLADAKGFTCFAEGTQGKAVMGERIVWEPNLHLKAAAPNPGRFIVLKDGKRIYETEGKEMTCPIMEHGKFRVEVELNILGEWTPWIYSNPIEVTGVSAS